MPGKICSIANCRSNSQRVKENGENVMFFSFPKDYETCKEWVRRCCRKDMFNVKYKRVCSKHFSLDDYEDQLKASLMGTQPKILKKTAVPTLLLPKRKKVKPPATSDEEIQAKVEIQRQKAIIAELSNECVPVAENENLKQTQYSITENGSMFEIVGDNSEDKPSIKSKPRLYKSAVSSNDLSEDAALKGVVSSTCAEIDEILEEETDGINFVPQKSTSAINGHSKPNTTNYCENMSETLASNDSILTDDVPSKQPAVADVITEDSFKEMCRCCLINKGEMNVFEAHFQNLPISEMIQFCTNENISPNENQPKSICNICLQLIIASYTFIKTVKESQVHIREFQQLFKDTSTINNYDTTMSNEDSSIQIDDISAKKPQTNGFKQKFRKLNRIYRELCDVLEENRKEINRPDKLNEVRAERGFLKVLPTSKDSKEAAGNGKEILSSIVKGLLTGNSVEMAVEDCQKSVEVHSLPGDILETNLKKIVSSDFDGMKIQYNNGIPQISTEKKVRHFACSECTESFTTEPNFLRHSRETGHVIPARFKCKHCSETFYSSGKYNAHLENHRSEGKKICEICGLSLAPNNILRHLRTHAKKPKHSCRICGKEFNYKGYLDLHIKSKHSEIKHHCLCFICGRTFSCLSTLNKHLNDEHHEEDLANKSYSCNKCHKYFATEISLKLHRKCDEPTVKKCLVRSHQCPLCARNFRTDARLKLHLLKHRGGMPYRCSYCTKTFRFKRYFDNHVRSHTEIDTYDCSICDKTFSHILLLQRHKQSHMMSNEDEFMEQKLKPNVDDESMEESNDTELFEEANDYDLLEEPNNYDDLLKEQYELIEEEIVESNDDDNDDSS